MWPFKPRRAPEGDFIFPPALRPCPFCGAQGLKVHVGRHVGWVTCRTCLAEGPAFRKSDHFMSISVLHGASEAWNTRKDPNPRLCGCRTVYLAPGDKCPYCKEKRDG